MAGHDRESTKSTVAPVHQGVLPDQAARVQPAVMLIFFAALAIVAGRIAVVRSADGETAFLSANDRSRWSTVAALVEDNTYEIDRLIEIRDPVDRHRRPFDTIDKVMHVGDDGGFHAYSSKPPLLATIVAAIYWPIHAATGLTITQHPGYVPRMILAIFNLPVLACFFFASWSVCRGYLTTTWSQIFVAVAIGFGTMLTSMAVTLNNHLPAAAATAIVMAIYCGGQNVGENRDKLSPVQCLVAGAAAALAVVFELPALSMFCLWGVLFGTGLWRQRIVAARDHAIGRDGPRVAPLGWSTGSSSVFPSVFPNASSIAAGCVGIMIVAAAFFGTNWIAHRSLAMPYAHRGVGDGIEVVDSPDQFDASKWRREVSDEPGRWRLWSLTGERSRAIVASGDRFEIRQWDDWYEYPGSYWQDGRRVGVDRGEADRGVYAFHMLVGHHGVFSLTPIWCLMPVGLAMLIWRGQTLSPLERSTSDRRGRWWFERFVCDDRAMLAAATAMVTIVCIGFYLARPQIDRNYGGVSCCFRWLLWLAPLWFFACSATIGRFAHRRWFRHFASVLLVFGIFSVSLSITNPWQSPWIMRWLDFLG